MNTYSFVSLFLLVFMACNHPIDAQKTEKNIDFNELSISFLNKAKVGDDTSEVRSVLSNATLQELENTLNTDNKRLAFWVNIYNAYILYFLKDDPSLYEDRGSFFKDEKINIAGEQISFAKIEHGIIRKSQWEYGLGKIRKWFPDKFERKLRVDKRDYRIHFALNCGAKDCPPVATYEWERLDAQFEKSTQKYLKRTTDYNKEKKEVSVTSLFSWFRGDFGNKSGIKKILKDNELIPSTKDVNIVYKSYDWTLDLNNFIEL